MKKMVLVGIVILAVSMVVNGYLYIQTQNKLQTQIKINDDLSDSIVHATTQISTLQNERNTLADERDALKEDVVLLGDQKDEARANEEILQGSVNQLNVDVATLTVERDNLKTQIVELGSALDASRLEADSVRNRLILVNHQVTDNGTSISYSGFFVNTGINDAVNIGFRILGYDLTGQKVIDLTQGDMGSMVGSTVPAPSRLYPWSVKSGMYLEYANVLDYSPLNLSGWSATLVWDTTPPL